MAVAPGTGVAVGRGVAVGAGVAVGSGATVGCAVAVGTGVAVAVGTVAPVVAAMSTGITRLGRNIAVTAGDTVAPWTENVTCWPSSAEETWTSIRYWPAEKPERPVALVPTIVPSASAACTTVN